jgi:putative glutamine amidotransferase
VSAPLIGISMLLDSNHERGFYNRSRLEFQTVSYGAWVAAHGGLPVALPLAGDARITDLVARLDGLLLSGGPDLDLRFDPGVPAPADPDESDDLRRTHFEHSLLMAALERRIPVLGVCRGLQQMAVSLGGSLWQDLPTEPGIEGHSCPEQHSQVVHDVILEGPVPACFAALPRRFGVNSTHHQAVRVAGRGLEVFARSADHAAVIEGMAGTDPGQWLVGVQWHPERLPGEEASRALMADFLAACGQRARESR